jgi:hypothetical protein
MYISHGKKQDLTKFENPDKKIIWIQFSSLLYSLINKINRCNLKILRDIKTFFFLL